MKTLFSISDATAYRFVYEENGRYVVRSVAHTYRGQYPGAHISETVFSSYEAAVRFAAGKGEAVMTEYFPVTGSDVIVVHVYEGSGTRSNVTRCGIRLPDGHNVVSPMSTVGRDCSECWEVKA